MASCTGYFSRCYCVETSITRTIGGGTVSEPYYDVILPHGGVLVDRVLRGEVREAVRERAERMLKIPLDRMGLSDLELLAVGAFSPLTGFMLKADYDRCVEEMRLTNGLVWTIPITLAVEKDLADRIKEGQEVALCEGERVLAVMEVAEKYPYDRKVKEREAKEVYRTTDEAHPGVARLYRRGEVLLGGDIWLVDWPTAAKTEFPELRHTPAQTRRMFARRGWRSVVGFQTRNPIHRAHEYIQKTALEIVDGLFLHPLVGETKKDDIPAEVRIASYQAILRDYYPAERVILGVFPAAMRYAGPREAVFHAICRKNYGCTHFIVGRDHAGVGNYYGTYDAQNIFDEFPPEDIGIVPLKFEHAFYCRKCGGVVSAKTCPHGPEDRVYLSGTQVRQMLERGEMLPEEFTRPEVARILLEGFRQWKRAQQG
ncbi:MAG TPA: sulfate adenylyltransferase [Chloroflexi bacterium]|nr:sulfate adenylyltransferase [Chloroflexota bacterium]